MASSLLLGAISLPEGKKGGLTMDPLPSLLGGRICFREVDELVKEADTEKEGYVNYEGRNARIRSSKNNPDPEPT